MLWSAVEHGISWHVTGPAAPVLVTIADIDPDRPRDAAETFGFARWTADWKELVADPAVEDIV